MDIREPLVGVRWWAIEGHHRKPDLLYGIYGSTTAAPIPWSPGVVKGRCYGFLRPSPDGFKEHYVREDHNTPHEKCPCGITAFHDVQGALGYHSVGSQVLGLIRGWGNIRVHNNGFRAQWGEIQALVWLGMHLRKHPNLCRATVRRLADIYGVPLLQPQSADQLTVMMGEYGATVPVEDRPEARYPSSGW